MEEWKSWLFAFDPSIILKIMSLETKHPKKSQKKGFYQLWYNNNQ
jgi:hypothetical protein